MQYLQEDFDELKQICDYVNQNNDVVPPLFLYSLSHLKTSPTRTEIDTGLFVPTSIEAIRILRNLRRRFDPSETKRPLVSQMRVEVHPRQRPERSVHVLSLQSTSREIAEIGGQSYFSNFQIEGWKKVLQVLNQAQMKQTSALVITAPTGAGKTEVFLLPIIRQIASALVHSKTDDTIPRFAIIYPRIALAQDQIVRTFQYVERAENHLKSRTNKHIIVGFQFTGIRSQRENTLKDPKVFRHNGSDYEFLLLDKCPWCKKRLRLIFRARFDYTYLSCPVCNKEACVSISKDDHRDMKPHLMLTTAESLDRMYLDWDFKEYLISFYGIVLDEAHLFNQVYGAHIHRLLQRIHKLIKKQSRHELSFIASSATIADPADFANRLFFGSHSSNNIVDTISAENYPQMLSGLETFCFLQAPNAQYGKSNSLSTMIQTGMAMGHGILKDPRKMIIFAESLDIAGRLEAQLNDAESQRKLWNMRVDITTPHLAFNGYTCPRTSPLLCSNIYMKGECWRGAIGGCQCYNSVQGLRTTSLPIQIVTGSTQGQRSLKEPVIIGTSALEVGIDDASVQATLHYRPPRTIFDFIQRRGRAGRELGDSAYTIVVLGKKPSDYYYLTRRHRLINGKYDLPLNPDNPIIKETHEWLETARNEAFALMQRYGEQRGIWKWILCKLNHCPTIQARYGSELNTIGQYVEKEKQQQSLKEWIENGRKEAEGQIGVEWEIPKRKLQIATPQLLAIMDDLVNHFREWLDLNLSDADFIKELLRIRQDAANFVAQPSQTGQHSFSSLVKEYGIVLQSILEVEDLARKTRAQVKDSIESGKAWFEFFSRLAYLFENYNLFVLFGAVKVIYQALYLLHQGLAPHSCSANIPVYIPENYFGSIQPMRVELPGNQIASEAITSLSTLFTPYRIGYRYEARSLYTLETRTLGTANSDHVRLRPAAGGPQGKDINNRSIIQVKSIQLRKLQSDASQNLGLCQSCLQIYDLNRQNTTCRCGGYIVGGRIYPIKNYIDNGFEMANAIPIASTFAILPSLKAWTTVRGSQVSFKSQSNQERQFWAWLNPALYYELPTKGIQWKVPGQPNKEQLNTAANLLQKTMASTVGVREDKLAHSYDEKTGIALVWETSEGGAGLSEVFADILQKNPLQIYLEMIATIACPIYLAEQYLKLWKNQSDLISYLAKQFNLPETEPLFEEIAIEAQAERTYQDKEGQICEKYDGCPACIQTSQSETDEQPKRSLAW